MGIVRKTRWDAGAKPKDLAPGPDPRLGLATLRDLQRGQNRPCIQSSQSRIDASNPLCPKQQWHWHSYSITFLLSFGHHLASVKYYVLSAWKSETMGLKSNSLGKLLNFFQPVSSPANPRIKWNNGYCMFSPGPGIVDMLSWFFFLIQMQTSGSCYLLTLCLVKLCPLTSKCVLHPHAPCTLSPLVPAWCHQPLPPYAFPFILW